MVKGFKGLICALTESRPSGMNLDVLKVKSPHRFCLFVGTRCGIFYNFVTVTSVRALLRN